MTTWASEHKKQQRTRRRRKKTKHYARHLTEQSQQTGCDVSYHSNTNHDSDFIKKIDKRKWKVYLLWSSEGNVVEQGNGELQPQKPPSNHNEGVQTETGSRAHCDLTAISRLLFNFSHALYSSRIKKKEQSLFAPKFLKNPNLKSLTPFVFQFYFRKI